MDPMELLRTKLTNVEKDIGDALLINRNIQWDRVKDINMKIDIFVEDAFRQIREAIRLIVGVQQDVR